MKGTNTCRTAVCFAGTFILLHLFFCTCAHGNLLREKSYIVRSDRGRDILCEPYTVQKNDWVYKLFRQKGEISHKDFPEFIGIFQRLNPHVYNINTIRPGQLILIPLKKLDYGSFPGQSEGIVTIPFVTVSKVSDILHKYSSSHKIKRGDTIFGIMRRRFAPFGSESFNRGMKLFRSINPDITDLNRIYVGQSIRVPDAEITRQPWYASLFDESGNLKTEIVIKDPMGTASPGTRNHALSVKDFDPLKPGRKKHEKSVSDLEKAARIVNARLRNRGTYYFPNPGGMDFQLDMSRFPMVELESGRRIIFQDKDILFRADLDKIRSFWPDTEVVSAAPHTSLRQILDLFLTKQGQTYEDNHLKLSDHGIDITIRANWITRIKSCSGHEPDRLCITLIENQDEYTHPAIIRYLADHNILIREIVYRGTADTAPALHEPRNKKTVTHDPVVMDTRDPRTFISRLLTSLGFSYAPDIPITFPYAGIQVEARSNLVSSADGRSVLIDFGDLYGDAVSAIKQSGLDIVQLKPDETSDTILRKTLTALAVPFQAGPVFLAARRPEFFNTAITIPGYLIHGGQSDTLLCMHDLDGNIIRFLRERGISVIQYIRDTGILNKKGDTATKKPEKQT